KLDVLAAGDNGSVRLFGAVADGVWEIWVRPAGLDTHTRRIVAAENAEGGYLIGARADALVFSRYTHGTWNTLSAPPPPLGRWTQVVAAYDGTRMTLYVNGAQVAERSSTLSLPDPWSWDAGDVVRLGAQSHRWLEWDGWLDEAAYYGRAGALTPSAIARP